MWVIPGSIIDASKEADAGGNVRILFVGSSNRAVKLNGTTELLDKRGMRSFRLVIGLTTSKDGQVVGVDEIITVEGIESGLSDISDLGSVGEIEENIDTDSSSVSFDNQVDELHFKDGSTRAGSKAKEVFNRTFYIVEIAHWSHSATNVLGEDAFYIQVGNNIDWGRVDELSVQVPDDVLSNFFPGGVDGLGFAGGWVGAIGNAFVVNDDAAVAGLAVGASSSPKYVAVLASAFVFFGGCSGEAQVIATHAGAIGTRNEVIVISARRAFVLLGAGNGERMAGSKIQQYNCK